MGIVTDEPSAEELLLPATTSHASIGNARRKDSRPLSSSRRRGQRRQERGSGRTIALNLEA